MGTDPVHMFKYDPSATCRVAGPRPESFEGDVDSARQVCESPAVASRRTGWTEFRDVSDLGSLLGLDDDLPDDFLARFMSMPNAREYVTSRTEVPRMPPGVIGYLIPTTRFFVNLSTWRSLFGDATTAMLVYTYAQSVPAAAAAAAIRKAHADLRRLSEDEAELVHVIIGLADGRNPYKTPVEESQVKAAYVDAKVSLDALMQSLVDKGVLLTRLDGRLLLVC